MAHASMRVRFSRYLSLLALLFLAPAGALEPTEEDYALKLLGKYIFFDNISNPPRMSCATCHEPANGGTGNNPGVNRHQVVITGADPHTRGTLKPPTNAYASFIEPLGPCAPNVVAAPPSGDLCGGHFWNGRAEGRGADQGGPLFPATASGHIGEEVFQGSTDPALIGYAKYFGPIADQALNPMPNPVEQNISRQGVCQHVAGTKYAALYEQAWGEALDCSDQAAAVSSPYAASPEKAFDISFKRLMLAVSAWQHSRELNSFSSRRDQAVRAELACVNGSPDCDPAVSQHPNYINSPGAFPLVGLTDQENLGHDIFYNTRFNPRPGLAVSNCAACHTDSPLQPGEDMRLEQRYTDDAFHNIGIPRNPDMPDDTDPGLGGHTGAPAGFYKTPTLRNVDKRRGEGFLKAYGHNGWFKSLESIVHFYNTAAVKPRCPAGIETEAQALANDCWPAPKHAGPGSAIPFLLGNLGMSAEEEAAVVAYIKTFTDQETVKAPTPYKPVGNKAKGNGKGR